MATKPKKAKKPVDPRDAIIDEILNREEFRIHTQSDLNEQMRYLASRMLSKAMEAEMDVHLGYGKREEKPEDQSDERNGHTSRQVQSGLGQLELKVPRDRDSSFQPAILTKYQRRLEGIDEQILSLYSRGMSTREIRDFFKDQYGTDVSPELISHVTDEVISDVEAWQKEPLEDMYPIVYFDAIRVKVRDDDKVVRPKAIYIALGVTTEGIRRVIGLWIAATESATLWLQNFNELKQRGLKDILIAVTDGLTGMPEALENAYPMTKHQTCIVHMIRNSLKWVAWRDYKPVTEELKKIYGAETEALAKSAFEAFKKSACAKKYPEIIKQWHDNWERVVPFFEFSEPIRKMVYTTNPIESMNRQIRKGIKTRGVFPTDTAAIKLVWLILRNCQRHWKIASPHWRQVKHEFALMFGERFSEHCMD